MVRWPEERRRLDELRASRVPRLLLIAPEIAAPDISDCLEDWVRLPAEDRDVRTRLATLLARAGSGHARPTIDSDGLLRFPSTLGVTVASRTVARKCARRGTSVRLLPATTSPFARGRPACRHATRSTCTCCDFAGESLHWAWRSERFARAGTSCKQADGVRRPNLRAPSGDGRHADDLHGKLPLWSLVGDKVTRFVACECLPER